MYVGIMYIYIYMCVYTYICLHEPVPVTTRSKSYVCGRSTAEIVGSNPGGSMDVCACDCYVLSGGGLCDKLITRTREFYRLWCVIVYDIETS
jgi:hypothetical protein